MPKPAPTPALRIPLARARAHWHRLQGLADSPKASLDEMIAQTGWIRTLGGADVYLAARARRPAMKRAELDAAHDDGRVHVSPAVRGCIYLVPRAHIPLAMRVAEEAWRKRAERDVEKAGATWKEVRDAAAAALEVLKNPLSTDAVRRALPEGTIRSLGERGKKVGTSSVLPVALRDLEFAGRIERTLEDGRLDSERYVWRRPKKNPVEAAKVPTDPIARLARLAEIFFAQFGPATIKDFAEWAAISARDADAAAAKAPLAPVAVDTYAPTAFALESDLRALKAPAKPSSSVRFLSFEDNYLTSHGGPGLLADPAHHARKVDAWGSGKSESTLGTVKHLAARSIFVGDALAGFWEFDPDTSKVATALLDAVPTKTRKEIDALADDTATFLRDQVGHGRSFSLDTDDQLRERTKRVLALAKEKPRKTS